LRALRGSVEGENLLPGYQRTARAGVPAVNVEKNPCHEKKIG
jgi:hypothetical protein